MNCPHCNKEMIVKRKDISHNPENKKNYDRTVYWCEEDDVWANLEVPKEL